MDTCPTMMEILYNSVNSEVTEGRGGEEEIQAGKLKWKFVIIQCQLRKLILYTQNIL